MCVWRVLFKGAIDNSDQSRFGPKTPALVSTFMGPSCRDTSALVPKCLKDNWVQLSAELAWPVDRSVSPYFCGELSVDYHPSSDRNYLSKTPLTYQPVRLLHQRQHRRCDDSRKSRVVFRWAIIMIRQGVAYSPYYTLFHRQKTVAKKRNKKEKKKNIYNTIRISSTSSKYQTA